MPKVPKVEDSKLQIEIFDIPEQKSPITSPRLTRKSVAEMELNILLKFVKPFDGSRDKLNSFITNCNNAYELASDSQRPILFKYILCQLTGKAETACSIKEFSSWEQLKEFLKTQFSERKHYTHLLTDLQEGKQSQTENVSQFALRMETYLSQLLTEISLSNHKVKEIPGRTAAMEDLTLHHFLMGLHPRISNIVRCRAPKTFNEAVNLAVSEERIQQTLYKRTNIPSSPLEKENKIRFKPKFSAQNQMTKVKSPQSSFIKANPNLECRYCKEVGHDINNCLKRQLSHKRFASSYPQKDIYNKPSGSQPHKSPTVNFVSEDNDEEQVEPEYESTEEEEIPEDLNL